MSVNSMYYKKSGSEESCAEEGTRTPTLVEHHPLKMACLPISPLPLEIGAPGETRTPNHLIRSQVLYPIELRVRCN